MEDGFCDQCKPGGKPGLILNDYTGEWVTCPHVYQANLDASQEAGRQSREDYGRLYEAYSSQIIQINKLSVEVSKLKKKLAGNSPLVTVDDEREAGAYEDLRQKFVLAQAQVGLLEEALKVIREKAYTADREARDRLPSVVMDIVNDALRAIKTEGVMKDVISTVLQATITSMEDSTLYELARGLMLSTCDRRQFLDALFDELDRRAEAARKRIASLRD